MTRVLTASLARIETAVNALQNGAVIALPTDTLYALAADARVAAAVRRVYAIKGREDGKPLPLFVDGLSLAETVGVLDNRSRALAGRFWPGALTIVVNRQSTFNSEALAGGDTVALRAPDAALALDVIRQLGAPITGTSANRSGGPDPVTADDVRYQLGDEVDLIIDGGACPGGVSSTIVDCTGDDVVILRQGAILEAQIRAVLEQAT